MMPRVVLLIFIGLPLILISVLMVWRIQKTGGLRAYWAIQKGEFEKATPQEIKFFIVQIFFFGIAIGLFIAWLIERSLGQPRQYLLSFASILCLLSAIISLHFRRKRLNKKDSA